MQQNEARQLISNAKFSTEPQLWLDLGCGSGTFTLALAELLPAGSRVIGMDKNKQQLPAAASNGNKIEFVQTDFSNELNLPQKIDGVLMANALHYIQHKDEMLARLKKLMPIFNLILIEYDTDRANPWVPYPIRFIELENFFEGASIVKLGERQSIYNRNKMYAAQVSF